MLELKSDSLIEYYGKFPQNYSIKFLHYNIELKSETAEEYKLLQEDLINIKNEIGTETFKIYFSELQTYEKVLKNTNIVDELSEYIYLKVRNNAEYQKVRETFTFEGLKLLINIKDFLELDNQDKITEDIILQIDNFSEISSNNLNKIAEKYNINKVCVGQIPYSNIYYKNFLKEKIKQFGLDENNNDSYLTVEKEILISNDIYGIKEYNMLEEKLKSLQNGIVGNDTDVIKFTKIYNNIINTINYNWSDLNENNLEDQNLVGGLFKNTCVCEGFSKILQQSLYLVGIKSIIVGGGGAKEEGGHLWNQVNIDGKWYNADAASDSIRRERNQEPIFCLFKDREDFMIDSIVSNKCNETYDYDINKIK